MSQRTKIVLPVLLVLIAAAVSAQAPPVDRATLFPAGPGDLAAEMLTAPVAAKAAVEVPREAVTYSHGVEADMVLAPATEPFVKTSREYWVEVSAAELRAGVPVYTLAPGALVRLNPATGTDAGLAEKAALDPRALVLLDRDGRRFAGDAGMELLVDAAALAKSGAPFPAGTSAFRVAEELGAGPFELRAEGLAGDARYVMHVFDRASDVALALTTDRRTYLHGDTLTIEARLVRGDASLAAREIDGYVTSPAGRAFPVTFSRKADGAYRAKLVLDALETPAPGLWEVHASANGRVDGAVTMRFARTAFGCAVPSARLDGTVKLATGDALTVRLGLEVAAAGRYDLRGVLFGTSADGTLEPVGVAQAAAWLDAGAGNLELSFPTGLFEGRDLGAPFEVRDLRLMDQGRLGVLHRQARGLVIE